jgi:hypothetical protein
MRLLRGPSLSILLLLNALFLPILPVFAFLFGFVATVPTAAMFIIELLLLLDADALLLHFVFLSLLSSLLLLLLLLLLLSLNTNAFLLSLLVVSAVLFGFVATVSTAGADSDEHKSDSYLA